MRSKRSFGIVLVFANIVWGQSAVETGLYLSFNKNGPIATGRIASVHIERQSTDTESGTLSVDIAQHLREDQYGDQLPDRFETRFAWAAPGSVEYAMTQMKTAPPYGFGRVRPVSGMNVLLIFDRHKPTTVPPLAVLDLDNGEAAWIPLIKRAIELSSLKGSVRVDALLRCLEDPQKFIRVVSMHQLRETAECQSGSACADSVVTVLEKRSKAGTVLERSEAVDWLAHDSYDSTAGPTSTNNKIATITLALVADSDPAIREQAIDNLDQMLSPDRRWRPDLAHLAIHNRKAVLEALQQECHTGGTKADKARRVSAALE